MWTRVIGWGLIGSIVLAPPALGQFRSGDMQPWVSAGTTPGTGDGDDAVDIGDLRLGWGHYFRDRLGFYAEFSVYRPTGRHFNDDAATWAAGMATALRWHFVRRPVFSLFADWGVGAMYGADAFPPGGTHANFTLHFGMGAWVGLSNSVGLVAGARQLHMSNGRGVGPQNPSFDGLGVYAGVTLRPRFKPALPAPAEPLGYRAEGLRLRVDAFLDRVDEEDSPGGAVALDVALVPAHKLYGQVAFALARLAGEETWDASVYVYRQSDSQRWTVGYRRKEFNVFTSDFFIAQFDGVINDITDLTIAAAYERKNLADDRVYGGVFLTVYPVSALALRSGVGFERQEAELFDDLDNLNDAGYNFGVEFFPPLLRDAGLSVYVEGGIGYDRETVGLRYQSGGGRSTVARRSGGGFIPLR